MEQRGSGDASVALVLLWVIAIIVTVSMAVQWVAYDCPPWAIRDIGGGCWVR